jgi:hypothetical protein
MKVPKFADLPTGHTDEEALNRVIEMIENDKSKIWNSIELYSYYTDRGGGQAL